MTTIIGTILAEKSGYKFRVVLTDGTKNEAQACQSHTENIQLQQKRDAHQSLERIHLALSMSEIPPAFPCPLAQQYIEEITEGADKQLKIEVGLAEITEKWAAESFVFSEWKGRGINVLKSTGTIVEELEEAQV